MPSHDNPANEHHIELQSNHCNLLQPGVLTILEAIVTECQVELSCHSLRCRNHPFYTWSIDSVWFSFSIFLSTFALFCWLCWQVWVSTAQLLTFLLASSVFQLFQAALSPQIFGVFLCPGWLAMCRLPFNI